MIPDPEYFDETGKRFWLQSIVELIVPMGIIVLMVGTIVWAVNAG